MVGNKQCLLFNWGSWVNLGKERIVQAQVKGNTILIVPVDVEPRYAPEELEGLDRLHEDEKKKGWISLDLTQDIDKLLAAQTRIQSNPLVPSDHNSAIAFSAKRRRSQ